VPVHPEPPPGARLPAASPDGLGRFSAAFRELASLRDVDETLQLAVDLATELVPGCDVADVMFLGRGGVTTPVSSDPIAVAIDAIQSETGEGPCIEAGRSHPVVFADDLAVDERWPSFGPRAVAEADVRSALSFQLYLQRHQDDRFGALNLYGRQRTAFDARSIALGEIFATHCTTTLAAAIAGEGAEAALASRDLIGQAKGVLMATQQVSAVEAFDLLKRCSQDRNLKLRDVAEHVTRTGTLPNA
jgi:hypothetical protein